MGSGSAVTSSNASASYDLVNRKTRLIDSGTNIKAATKVGAGQQAYCDSASAGMLKGYPYVTDSTNTVWENETSNYLYPENWGRYNPVSATFATNLNGLLRASTSSGTVALAALDTTNGLAGTFATAASNGSTGGFNMGLLYTVRNFNPIAKVKMQLSSVAANTRFFFGWSSSTAAIGNNDDMLNAASGFGISKITINTTARISHNDGSGATINDNTSLTWDTNPHTFDLWADDNGSQFYYSIDGATPVAVTSEIPATTTPLNFQIIVITAEAVAKTLSCYGMYISSDK